MFNRVKRRKSIQVYIYQNKSRIRLQAIKILCIEKWIFLRAHIGNEYRSRYGIFFGWLLSDRLGSPEKWWSLSNQSRPQFFSIHEIHKLWKFTDYEYCSSIRSIYCGFQLWSWDGRYNMFVSPVIGNLIWIRDKIGYSCSNIFIKRYFHSNLHVEQTYEM